MTWQDSRRSASLAERRGLRRHVLVDGWSGGLRHVIGAIYTAVLLMRRRPHEVWYQYSLVLGLVLSTYRRLLPRICARLIADVHTKALRRDGGRLARPIVLTLKGWSLRGCKAVLVTNPEDQDFAKRLGVRAFVLPDPLPSVPGERPGISEAPALAKSQATTRATAPADRQEVVFVCSFARDEPFTLMEATSVLLGHDARPAFTGDPRVLPSEHRSRLSEVGRLTGFLPDVEYWRLLRRAAAIVVLTTEPACLPCGAYEAIALGRRPVLLADERAREVFGDLALYAAAEPHRLAKAITSACGVAGLCGPLEVAEYERRWRAWWQTLPAPIRTPPR